MFLDYTTGIIYIMMISLWSFHSSRVSLVHYLIYIEVCLYSISILWLQSSIYIDDISGQLLCILILTLSAVESALGLSLILNYFRILGSILIINITHIKGWWCI